LHFFHKKDFPRGFAKGGKAFDKEGKKCENAAYHASMMSSSEPFPFSKPRFFQGFPLFMAWREGKCENSASWAAQE
jgi:uncharacterized protein YifE (UPF0438 family)